MNAKRLSRISVPLVLLWLLSLPAQAAVEAGRILFARGTVSIVDENQSARGGSVGSVFYEGDRIVTGNNSIAQLRLSDGALTALRSHSDYQIQRQRFDEANKVYEQAGRLVAGWMRSVTGAIGARYPGNVSQGTSVATIGIRGTTYQIIHVPDEGLPEFPNLQPGTYVYLESGQVEVSNEAGSRIVNPGQVVRITGANVEPELVPELVELFQSQLLSSVQGGSDDEFSLRELLEGTEDVLVDTLVGNSPKPFSGTVSGVGAFGGDFGVAGRAASANLVWTGENANRYVEAMTLDGSNGDTTDPYDLSANGSGLVGGQQYRQIIGEEGLASQVHWGLWTGGHFDALDPGGLPVSSTGVWHYMFADNALENGSNDIVGLGLTGRFAYNYIGGTELNAVNSDGLPIALMGMIDTATILVDFGSLNMDIDISFDNGSDFYRLVGSGNVDSFYSGGIFLDSTSGFGNTSGLISGTFVGQQAEGIISALSVSDSINFVYYYGTAAFQREFGEAEVFGGVAALESNAGRFRAVLPTWSVEIGGSGTGTFLQSAVLPGPSVDVYQATALGTAPAFQDHASIAGVNDSVEVYWGIWDVPIAPEPASYEVTNLSSGSPATPTGGWHYMIADNVLGVANVEGLGLTGTFTYNYAGGTVLENPVSGLTAVVDPTSSIAVNFGNLFAIDGVVISLDIGGATLSGQGDIGALYNGFGISVTDGMAFGSVSGAFAGAEAQALMTAIDYNDGINESYYGTALFEKGAEVLPVP